MPVDGEQNKQFASVKVVGCWKLWKAKFIFLMFTMLIFKERIHVSSTFVFSVEILFSKRRKCSFLMNVIWWIKAFITIRANTNRIILSLIIKIWEKLAILRMLFLIVLCSIGSKERLVIQFNIKHFFEYLSLGLR